MKKRIISAIIMVLIFVPILIKGDIWFTGLMTILSLFGLYEIIHVRDRKNKIPVYMKLVAYLFTLLLCLNNSNDITSNYTVNYQFISAFIFVLLGPIVIINNNSKYNINDALYLLACVLFIGFSFNLLIITRNYDLNYMIYLLLITIMTDTFAYFTGYLIGEHKLSPDISPNKTIEGSIGGSIMGTFIATCFYVTVIGGHNLLYVVGVTFLLTLVGQLGDLVFSGIKRYYGKKDFSDLIPGHGGILDRLDSLIFVVLAFILFINIV